MSTITNHGSFSTALDAFLKRDLKRAARAARPDRYLELCGDGSYRTFVLEDVSSPSFRHTEPGSLIVKLPAQPTQDSVRAAFNAALAAWQEQKKPIWHVDVRDGGFGMGVHVSFPILSELGAVGRSWDNGRAGERTEEYASFSRGAANWLDNERYQNQRAEHQQLAREAEYQYR